mmetsp:Transcript_26441/g.74401  ORF Transcript_26441/g.74401 Transcript_26441/m.74401 type:complete len:204 (-) Transcript_26441:385-996(-)
MQATPCTCCVHDPKLEGRVLAHQALSLQIYQEQQTPDQYIRNQRSSVTGLTFTPIRRGAADHMVIGFIWHPRRPRPAHFFGVNVSSKAWPPLATKAMTCCPSKPWMLTPIRCSSLPSDLTMPPNLQSWSPTSIPASLAGEASDTSSMMAKGSRSTFMGSASAAGGVGSSARGCFSAGSPASFTSFTRACSSCSFLSIFDETAL